MTPHPTPQELVRVTVKALNGQLAIEEPAGAPMSVWLTLAEAGDLLAAARSLKAIGARLSMITALADDGRGGNIVAYHFDIAGHTVTVKVWVVSGGSIDSIMTLFRNADWHEREFMEFYKIEVKDRADAKRLFLDESIEGGAMERLIPLSVLANATSTKMLWESLTVMPEEAK